MCGYSRRGKNTQFSFADLLPQSIYSRLAGYEDLNDAERLSPDPTFRLMGSKRIWDRGAALTSRLQTFETDMLAEDENFAGLGRLNRALVGKSITRQQPGRVRQGKTSPRHPAASMGTAPVANFLRRGSKAFQAKIEIDISPQAQGDATVEVQGQFLDQGAMRTQTNEGSVTITK